MRSPRLAIVFGFILGIGFTLPFTLAFRAPAAAEPTITLQNLADRLAVTEKALAQVRSTTTLADTVVAMGAQLNTLQSRVNSLQKGAQENDAAMAAALKALQDDTASNKAAIGFLNAAASINSKNNGGNIQQVAADLAALTKTFSGHTHPLFTSNTSSAVSLLNFPYPSCTSKGAFIPDNTCYGTNMQVVLTWAGGDFRSAATGTPK